MASKASRVLVVLVMVAAFVLVAYRYQQSDDLVARAEPEVSVSAPATPVPTRLPEAEPAVPVVIPSPDVSAMAPPRGEPTRVAVVDAAGNVLIDVPLVGTGLNQDGDLVPPIEAAGWYNESTWAQQKPGTLGPSVIAGHVSGRNSTEGIFYELDRVLPGDTVKVTYDSGDVIEFMVTKSEAVDKDVVTEAGTEAWRSVFNPGEDKAYLSVFTCDYNTTWSNGHYSGNWVVWAVRSK